MSADEDVLLNDIKHGSKYHLLVRESWGGMAACGTNPRDMRTMRRSVAQWLFRREPCGKCWRGEPS